MTEKICGLFHLNKNYICGISQQSWPTAEQGWNCLAKCILTLRQFPHHFKGDVVYYSCLICSRQYPHLNDVNQCFSKCRTKFNYPDHVNIAIDNFLKLALAKKRTLRKPLVKPAPPAKSLADLHDFEEFPPLPDTATLPSTTPTEEAEINQTPPAAEPTNEIPNQSAPVVESTQTETSASEEAPSEPNASSTPIDHLTDEDKNVSPQMLLPRKKGQVPFKRADARYVCTVCQEKYFTRAEVENHFEQHPLLD